MPNSKKASSINYALIGKRIRAARKANALTQESLAERLSISTNYFSKLERGVSPISLDLLGEISEILGVPLEKLVAGCIQCPVNPSALQNLTAEQGEQLISGMLAGQSQKVVATAVSLVDSLVKNLR